MKNFPVNIDGKEYWISRSVAVCGLVITNSNGLKILISKRGIGCPDEIGKWCCPCGYIDYGETILEALWREIAEETNLFINCKQTNLVKIDDNPKSNKQNITFTYLTVSNEYKEQSIYPKGMEENEVEDVRWIDLKELDNYDFAFNHKELIISIIKQNMNFYPISSWLDKESLEYLKRH